MNTKTVKLKFAKTDILKRLCTFNDTLDSNTRKIGYIMKSTVDSPSHNTASPTRYSYVPSSSYLQAPPSTFTRLDPLNYSYTRQDYSSTYQDRPTSSLSRPSNFQSPSPSLISDAYRYSDFSYSSRRPSQTRTYTSSLQTASNLPYTYGDYRR